ncbi:MAG TPA: sulfotransferase family 2 domain-containing protein [Opitutaceae bacterium]|nr:sulfotransferase family 2 domain-containing protein [Opitutaceae bacterium]
MINHQHRCIFVHIPKTAGNSVNRAFGVSWENHKDLRRYAAEIPAETFAAYAKFAIVRNPWDRIFSDYNYQRKKSRPRSSKLFLFEESGRRRNFRTWLEQALADPHRYAPETWGGEVSDGLHRWSPQVDWIRVNGRIAVDRVLRLEHLQEDYDRARQALRLPPLRLPHRNRRLHWHYSWYYDDAARDLVADYYAEDIATFGYQFDSRVEHLWPVLQTCLASAMWWLG